MLINGVDLSILGVKLYDRILTSNDVQTAEEWLDGDLQPTYIRQQDKFKTITLKFLVPEKDEERAFVVMSKLTAMLKKATIIFDDIDLSFDVVMRGAAKQERLKNGNFILTVSLDSDYAKGKVEIYTTDQTATDYFYLNVLYYRKGNILLATDKVLIKSSQFNDANINLEKLGIDVNKYQPNYYNNGIVSNFNGLLTYENLKLLQTLIINYSPTTYFKDVEYFIQSGDQAGGVYSSITKITISFTKEQVDNCTVIGQLVDLTANKPNGYRARTNFNLDFTFDNLMAFSPLEVYYDKIQDERSKDISVEYRKETDDGGFLTITSQIVNVREGNVVSGTKLKDIINVNAYKPEKYYDNGTCVEEDIDALVDYDSLQSTYTIDYLLTENNLIVEYYLGEYPEWTRITSNIYKIKYKTTYEDASDIITATGIDVNKYLTATYNYGIVYNRDLINTFDDLLNIGVLQIYYTPKDYTIRVSYVQEDVGLGYKDFVINDYMFIGNPTLGEIIDINAMRPEGYIYSPELSYQGEVSLSALTAASPIIITYVPVEQIRTKSILIKYKQELASAFSTLNTSIVTIEESAVGGGIRLSDLINLDAYRPDYYDKGIIDGASSNSVLLFDEIQGTYDVLYMASTYTTPVRYYTDEISNYNWIGSENLQYKIIDFTLSTTLTDLGLNINGFKPSYCGDGVVSYTGPITFTALINLDAINVVYPSIEEPIDPDGIDYPHRILFLQHNDMGNYEINFPTWTLNHAYINTGVTVQDMSKLTVLCETIRVFDTTPLYDVNVEDAYLFGSITPQGSYYIKYVNNTKYKSDYLLTGINTFNAMAGLGTPELVIEETSSEGFSRNTGISSSNRPGYSYATLTYTNLVQSNSAPMNVPLYLFACDQNGHYRGGIAGVGIASCKIMYDDTVIRDFVPVQFYDKIGDKVAPSNCLYDKVSQTFFEDARSLNSFNIMDDDAYIDTNPEHMIGCCYVNYFKDETLFNTATIWFRGSDFIDGAFDLYEKLFIDYYQPEFCGSGKIINLAEIGDVTFNNLKNKVINVKYESLGYNVTVNYYKDSVSEENLLGTKTIPLTEKDFAQVPTFGDIIPLMAFKPEGYKPTYNYPETKVTLSRILQHAPYDIVYEKVENPKIYTTKIVYLRKKFGVDVLNPINTYERLGEKTIILDETDFADGVYIEDYIKQYYDEMYPVSPIEGIPFYHTGKPYEWYEKDERLDTPADLKPEYLISYEPAPVYIDVDYYTDEVDEENLIASTTWKIQIDDWPDNAQFYLVDELPNSYIDKYKPVICGGGRLNNPSMMYTFESLVAKGSIEIIYDTLEEPHDPDSTMFPKKVLFFVMESNQNGTNNDWTKVSPPTGLHGECLYDSINIKTPYIDLGYTPKEIGRLRIETKAYALNTNATTSQFNPYGYVDDSYSYFLGYMGAVPYSKYGETQGDLDSKNNILMVGASNLSTDALSTKSPYSSGYLGFKGHTTIVGGFIYTSPLPQSFDGHSAWNLNTNSWNDGYDLESVRELEVGYRRGVYSIEGDNLEPIINDYNYAYHKMEGFGAETQNSNEPTKRLLGYDRDYIFELYRGGSYSQFEQAVVFNPLTVTIDAYNNYVEFYDYENSQSPEYQNIVNNDYDLFNYRCKPKGSLSLFITTNPDTGQINWKPMNSSCYISMNVMGNLTSLQVVGATNPWSDNFNPEISFTQQVITGVTQYGTPIYENKTETKNINYANYEVTTSSVVQRAAVWYIKIWDRDRLVRDLIPVAEGDPVYGYIAPSNCLFDKVTETFYTNQNKGGIYTSPIYVGGNFKGYQTTKVEPQEVYPLKVAHDPTLWGQIVVNYYDESNNFIANQYVEIPVNYKEDNETIYEICHYNDYKPNEFYHDGMIDIDLDLTHPTNKTLQQIFEAGSINVYYKLITFTKTVVYYQGDTRIGSKDLFYSIADIDAAETLDDLGIDVNLYQTDDFKPGRIVFNESVIAEDDIKAFIDASSPIVVYDKYTKEERPDLLYLEYFRGGAYDDSLITPDPNDANYLDCELDAVVLNPNGVIKYLNHYHQALYEDEKQDYFIAYQVDVVANYVPIHKGPARKYSTLAVIVDKGRYTIVEERNGWGRLKEYHNGWIMLAYTKEAVGPGQNPDFESDINAVTIPFGTSITISKLTVDRLWAFTPEYQSWIKTEEISYNQSGRLYNGLKMNVIHLDSINWENVSTLESVGINPQAWRLKYHEMSDFVYEGEYTEAAFSNIHNIDFVYPETIYSYNCIYYKDIKNSDNELGRESFSCSMSDWNPDWDKFIETSWKVEPETIREGQARANKDQARIYKEPLDDYNTYANTVNEMSKTSDEVVGTLYPTVELVGNPVTNNNGDIFYPINYLGPRYGGTNAPSNVQWWNGFALSTDIDILTPYSERIILHDINPILYRSTPLTLTWDYFGIGKNKYKPEIGNYDDGIFLWNPRSFDNSDIYFTFEEMATTTGQSILYVHTLQNFKSTGLMTIQLDEGNLIDDFTFIPDTLGSPSGIWDIEFKGNLYDDNSNTEISLPNFRIKELRKLLYKNKRAELTAPTYYTYASTIGSTRSETGNYTITNISNKRNATIVYSNGNDLTNFQTGYYTLNHVGGSGSVVQTEPDTLIDRTVDLTLEKYDGLRVFKYYAPIAKEYDYFWSITGYLSSTGMSITYPWKSYNGTGKASHPARNYYWGSTRQLNPAVDDLYPLDTYNMNFKQIKTHESKPFHYLKIWKNYNLEHYFVPIAKGSWLEDGRQIQKNCMYDIITNSLIEGSSGESISVYKEGTEIHPDTTYVPFEEWTFNQVDCDYAISTTAQTIGYRYPDILAETLITFPIDTIIPVYKYTEDSANHVDGKWYDTGYTWSKADSTTILSSDEYSIEQYRKPVAFKADQDRNYAVTYNLFKAPDSSTSTSSLQLASEQVVDVYAKCNDYYWTGAGWLPIRYTDDSYSDDSTQYVVVSSYLYAYSRPIANDKYQVMRLQSGTRFTTSRRLTINDKWVYVDNIGWIYTTDSTVSQLS